MSYNVITGELCAWSETYAGEKFHAVICDPPYGLSFMGKKWDDRVNAKAWGEAMLPHLLPGALVFMFGGTRTWHHLATGMEEAGFEMWDTMMWLHGQGFPKGGDISKLIDKANGTENVVGTIPDRWTGKGNTLNFSTDRLQSDCKVTVPGSEISAPWSGHKTTALKPAWEPILCFKKPLEGTYAEMVMKYGSGALNVDGGRISTADTLSFGSRAIGTANGIYGKQEPKGEGEQSPLGRYPANLILDEVSGAMLDEQTGVLTSGAMKKPYAYTNNGFSLGAPSGETKQIHDASSGGASRFFYCAKASSSERNAGLATKNTHPTVKPLSLIEYIAKLALPPKGIHTRRVLVPFSGSGSEIIGCNKAGWDEVVGIEQDATYCDIARARLVHWVRGDVAHG